MQCKWCWPHLISHSLAQSRATPSLYFPLLHTQILVSQLFHQELYWRTFDKHTFVEHGTTRLTRCNGWKEGTITDKFMCVRVAEQDMREQMANSNILTAAWHSLDENIINCSSSSSGGEEVTATAGETNQQILCVIFNIIFNSLMYD